MKFPPIKPKSMNSRVEKKEHTKKSVGVLLSLISRCCNSRWVRGRFPHFQFNPICMYLWTESVKCEIENERERVSEWVSGGCFIWPFAIYVKISTRYRNAIAWRSVQLKMENSDKIRARYKSKPLNLCWDYADVHVDALCIGFGQLKKKKRSKTTRTKPTTTVTMNSVLHASVFSTIHIHVVHTNKH